MDRHIRGRDGGGHAHGDGGRRRQDRHIRGGNMLLACRTENNYLYFENLIFVPFDGRLIDFSMLTVPEKDWLTQYHSFIMVKILPELTEKERSFFNPLIDFFV